MVGSGGPRSAIDWEPFRSFESIIDYSGGLVVYREDSATGGLPSVIMGAYGGIGTCEHIQR